MPDGGLGKLRRLADTGLLGRENARSDELRLDRATEKIQEHANAFPRGQDLRYQRLKAMQRTLDDLDRLPNLHGRVDRDDLIVTRAAAQRLDNMRGQSRDLFAKSHDVMNAGGILDRPVLRGIEEPGEDISRKHRFDEPDCAAFRRTSEPKPRGEARDVVLASETLGDEMLALRMHL